MGFDVKTLYLSNVAVLFLSAAASFYFWRQHRDVAGLRWWSLGTVVSGTGLLALGLFGPKPPLPIGSVAATLIIAGYIMVLESIRRFNGKAAAKARIAWLTLAFAAIFGIAVYMGANLSQRASIVSFALSLCAGFSGWQVFRGGKQEPLRARLPMAVIFAVMAAILVTRASLPLLHPAISDAESFYDPLHGVVPLVNSIIVVCLSIGVIMMANEQVSGRYRKHAQTDELTELPNRRFFLEQAERRSRAADGTGATCCILMMDLDHFSEVNESFGHAGGDQALVAFARLLREQLRPMDLVGRYGGEEFCALLPDVGMIEATRVANRLREAVAGRVIEMRGRALRITISIGVAPLRDGDLRASIRSADEALYQAKALGRDRVISSDDVPAARPNTNESAFDMAHRSRP
jgi:diguanylate cyclase (GGDEF)-like protein